MPLGAIGGFVGLYLSGYPLSFTASIGFIALMGPALPREPVGEGIVKERVGPRRLPRAVNRDPAGGVGDVGDDGGARHRGRDPSFGTSPCPRSTSGAA
jgi:hypothetical protein